ncbi:MAG TPA: AbrB/MazE/SpoVT family DNA-binding domain-containing protein [Thermomicrobiales bacterium]|nr:AbrB/MazE/SpoVT family DNA-binding domain-containing protein [Thermomicrobiales bacterium]
MTTITARVTSKGQITVPKLIRERLGIEAGDEIAFHFDDGDRLEIRPVHRKRLAEFRGLFSVDRTLPIAEERDASRAARARNVASPSAPIDG